MLTDADKTKLKKLCAKLSRIEDEVHCFKRHAEGKAWGDLVCACLDIGNACVAIDCALQREEKSNGQTDA